MLVTDTGSVDLSAQYCWNTFITMTLRTLCCHICSLFLSELQNVLSTETFSPVVVSDWKRFPKELRVHVRKPLRDGQYEYFKHSQYSEYSEYR